MGRIKTDLRNRLSSKVLNALMTISIKGPDNDDFPFERTCAIWSGSRNRRTELRLETSFFVNTYMYFAKFVSEVILIHVIILCEY